MNSFNTPLILGVVVVFAYLLAITVFVLDFIYALIDPRVRLEGLRQETNATTGAPRGLFARLRGWFSRRHRLPVPQRWKRPAPPAPTRQFLTWRQGREPPIPSQEISIPRRVVLRQAGKPTGAAPLQVHPLPLVGKKTKASWRWSQFRTTWREFWRYPSALVGLAIILIMLGISLYTIISVPRQEMLMAWRSQSEEGYSTYWYQNPEFAMPAWTNWFRVNKLPETFYLDSDSPNAVRTEEVNIEKGTTTLTLRFPFEYTYGDFPQDVVIFLRTEYKEKQPFVLLNWVTPDLRRVDLGGFAAFSRQAYYLSRQTRLERKLNGLPVKQGLFYDPTLSTPTPLKGTYLLEMKVLFFEPIGNFRAETLIYGKVFGWGGTDLHRRDLALGLLWGAPVALAFGFLGAVLSNVLAMFLAALGAWFGGWLDGLVQRLVEVNMIIPSLPVAILVYLMYSKSIWAVLGVMVLLNIFGSAIKNYRAVFLQIKEAPYIEAARTYGASHMRIIFTYLTPRILPVLIPALVVMVPGYVYLETTLAFLGVTDPYVPTWGKIIFDAMANRALEEYPYWLLEPMALLILTSLAFSLVGLALERIYNPRLRKE